MSQKTTAAREPSRVETVPGGGCIWSAELADFQSGTLRPFQRQPANWSILRRRSIIGRGGDYATGKSAKGRTGSSLSKPKRVAGAAV